MFFNILSAFTGAGLDNDIELLHTTDYEKKILSFVDLQPEVDFKIYDVELETNPGHIHTIEAGFKNKEVLVLVHGYAASAVFYFKVIKNLKDHFHIYAIDLFGLGASARPKLEKFDFDHIVDFFVEPLEEWRKKLKLDNFVLMGHSMGGYLCSQYYKLKRPPIKMLYLLSPAGFTYKSDEEIQGIVKKTPNYRTKFFKWAFSMFQNRKISPFSFPLFGTRNTMSKYFSGPRLKLNNEQAAVFTDYFASTMQKQISGEKALGVLLHYARYSKNPISDFLADMKDKKQLLIPIKVIYGISDWMDSEHSCTINEKLGLDLEIVTIPDCDHQIIYQNPEGIATLLKTDLARGYDKLSHEFIAKHK